MRVRVIRKVAAENRLTIGESENNGRKLELCVIYIYIYVRVAVAATGD